MTRSVEELAQTARLDEYYQLAQSPILQDITDRVCGCGYVGTSYATRSEADLIVNNLALKPGDELLDLGAGAGWPGLYLAKMSGCPVTLLDIPEKGLAVARARAIDDGMSDHVRVVRGDATRLPFGPNSFAAITHSDLLCCLRPKKLVLEECRRVVRSSGKMIFSVIEVAHGLSKEKHARALTSGPEFVGSDEPYEEMLKDAGWQIMIRKDRTAELERAYRDQIRAERRFEADLRRLRGDEAYDEGQEVWANKLAGVRDGLVRRNLYMAVPV